jgi:mRNA interferase MazF
MSLDRGSLVLVDLDPTVGREQHGIRPAIVISDVEALREQRFPVVCVVPVTGTPGVGPLYPRLSPGRSGLTKASYALCDQLRAVDKQRIRKEYGRISADELAAVDDAIWFFLAL